MLLHNKDDLLKNSGRTRKCNKIFPVTGKNPIEFKRVRRIHPKFKIGVLYLFIVLTQFLRVLSSVWVPRRRFIWKTVADVRSVSRCLMPCSSSKVLMRSCSDWTWLSISKTTIWESAGSSCTVFILYSVPIA